MVVLIILMFLFTFFYSPYNIVQNVEAGKYGNIVPTTSELQLLDKINENRSDNGAGPLKLNTTLWWVARAHSQDMIDYDFFDHSSSEQGQFNGVSFSERVRNYAEYENSYIGECIAYNTWGIDVEWCMSAWKNSPGHWDIIINPNFEEIGLGILVGDWDGYSNSALYTADFGGASVSVELFTDETDIEFSPEFPYEGQQVTISTTIYNLGVTDAYPVHIKFFDGDPDTGGLQVGDEQQIPHILIQGESAMVNTIWDTTGSSGEHDIYVVVDCDNLISETDEGNNKAFNTITVNDSIPSPPISPISLWKGWNLISFPNMVANTSLGYVLGSISAEYRAVQAYKSSDVSDPWKHCYIEKPSHMNDLCDLDNKMGFWIQIIDPNGAELSLNEESPNSSQIITLNRGWNLVGYPSSIKRLRDDALNNLTFGSEVDTIMHQDNATKVLKNLEDWEYMEPGKGYWMHATCDCEWVVENLVY
ncbi:MAG: hypothetical protein JSW00_01905 [Thermoplasmata archaeon]|nr:MAG: hypothetical protein JSW00_01905 [Thermoplasmata archaeon]